MKPGLGAGQSEGFEHLFRPASAEACEEKQEQPLRPDCGWVVVYSCGLSFGASSEPQGRSFCNRNVLH